MNRLTYGKNIDISPVIETKDYLSVFIPQLFPWEEEEKAEIILDDRHKIVVNRQAKILKRTDKGIIQLFIPFEKTADIYSCDLPAFLEEMGIKTESNNGIYCDGTEWDQSNAAEKALVCRGGMLSYVESPYWGGQYEFYFADERIRPRLGGRGIKILRFSYCDKDAWVRMESAFRTMLANKVNWSVSEFNCMLRYIGMWYEKRPNQIQVFMEDTEEVFDWTDISDLF